VNHLIVLCLRSVFDFEQGPNIVEVDSELAIIHPSTSAKLRNPIMPRAQNRRAHSPGARRVLR